PQRRAGAVPGPRGPAAGGAAMQEPQVTFLGRTLYLSGYDNRDGVDVRLIRGEEPRLSIGGWYDGGVGITAQEISLRDFLRGLGVTQKDVSACWDNWRKPPATRSAP